MFCPSTYPSSPSPSRRALMIGSSGPAVSIRMPTVGTLFVSCPCDGVTDTRRYKLSPNSSRRRVTALAFLRTSVSSSLDDAQRDAVQGRAGKALAKLHDAAPRVPCNRWLADDFVVLAMGSNPNPENSVLN